MFVIEAKAYTNREPFRNADKAFTRIKDDFNKEYLTTADTKEQCFRNIIEDFKY